ncbi:DUF4166 domain-containing protein [Lysobacter sp. MMG2]|uniref:DUF4166 domain-containing protein n=1 Tax=Lysobacter sp. MMG2 TaxID=2801338 RepID=UPI001C2208F0|nr:DUF4166 domain-containing protein [Lysobacter sp. MMG2]MBU8975814.1 DUF4166 domain-containing protein [Lysobacter sp. MMG2]
MHAVERWFADGFQRLHPRLRELHRHGGELEGLIRIEYGRAAAGWLGRRIARRMGLPPGRDTARLRVRIASDADVLHWHRVFDDADEMPSTFVPVGGWPSGYWRETLGPMQLALAVETKDGGWQWRLCAAWWNGMRVPLALLPRVAAGKRSDPGEGYVFDVRVTLPGLGLLFAYSGRLKSRSLTH